MQTFFVRSQTQIYGRLEIRDMNTQLVESLIQVILPLSPEERKLLETKLFWDSSEPTTPEIMKLAQSGGAFDFLVDEPDLYSFEDGEPI